MKTVYILDSHIKRIVVNVDENCLNFLLSLICSNVRINYPRLIIERDIGYCLLNQSIIDNNNTKFMIYGCKVNISNRNYEIIHHEKKR